MNTLSERWFEATKQQAFRKSLSALNVATWSAVVDHIGKKTNNRNPVVANQNQEACKLFVSLTDKQRRSLQTAFNYNSQKQVLWAVTGRPRVAGKAVSKAIAEEQVSNILRMMRKMKGRNQGQSLYVAGNIKTSDNSEQQKALNVMIHEQTSRLVDLAHVAALKLNAKHKTAAPTTKPAESEKTA